MTANPLQKYIQQPQLYVSLASNSALDKDIVHATLTGEVPVRAMTSRDEVITRNPEALLSGDAIEKIINSCVPEIKNVRELPMIDIEILLLAIKKATYGDRMKVTSKCPKCSTEVTKTVLIHELLDSITKLPEINFVDLSIANDSITVMLKPYTFTHCNQLSMNEFESKKRMAYLQSIFHAENSGASYKEKLKYVQEIEAITKTEMETIFDDMAKLSIELLCGSIIQINMKTGDGDNHVIVPVTDKSHIREFIMNLDASNHKILRTKLEEMNNFGVDKKVSYICSGDKETHTCDNIWDGEVYSNPSSFFG